METEKLTIESLFDEFLKISEALRTDRIQFPREEEQYLINIRYAEFKSLVKSYTKQCCIKFLVKKTIKRLGNITEISKGQILIDWRCENVEIAERDFINVGQEWDVYEIVEEKEFLKK